MNPQESTPPVSQSSKRVRFGMFGLGIGLFLGCLQVHSDVLKIALGAPGLILMLIGRSSLSAWKQLPDDGQDRRTGSGPQQQPPAMPSAANDGKTAKYSALRRTGAFLSDLLRRSLTWFFLSYVIVAAVVAARVPINDGSVVAIWRINAALNGWYITEDGQFIADGVDWRRIAIRQLCTLVLFLLSFALCRTGTARFRVIAARCRRNKAAIGVLLYLCAATILVLRVPCSIVTHRFNTSYRTVTTSRDTYAWLWAVGDGTVHVTTLVLEELALGLGGSVIGLICGVVGSNG